MNEKMLEELLNYIQTYSRDFEAVNKRLEEYHEAIAWANQHQLWHWIVKLTRELTYHFNIRTETFHMNNPDLEHSPEIMRNLWEQGRLFAKQGLAAARQRQNQEEELMFVGYLAELSGYNCLCDFEAAIRYLTWEAQLVEPDRKTFVGRDFALLGRVAGNVEDFLAARVCYQASLEIHEELDNKRAVAETLRWMAVNEEDLDNHDLAQQLFDRSDEIKKQLNKEG